MAARYVDFMTASISAHSTNIASTVIHAYTYHYNLSLCMCHVQPTVYQRNSYCIRDIHVTEAIRSYTPISRAPLIYGIPFTHADILIFSCAVAHLRGPALPSVTSLLHWQTSWKRQHIF